MNCIVAYHRIVWLEWWRNFKRREDFFWLTLLLILTLFLALFLWGAKVGILNKFIDVSIGYVDGKGIPIWIQSKKVEGFPIDLLEKNAGNEKIFPYREINSTEVSLPDEAVWGHDNKVGDESALSFTGWAVSSDDPLWTINFKNENNPEILSQTVVLSKNNFNKNFNCSVYIDFLKKRHPTAVKDLPLPNGDNLYCLVNNKIWLTLGFSDENQSDVFPFDIRWVDQIKTMEKISFLFPMELLNTIRLTKANPSVGYYPAFYDNFDDKLVKAFTIKKAYEHISKNIISCLDVDYEESYGDYNLIRPIRLHRLYECTHSHSKVVDIDSVIKLVDAPSNKYAFSYFDDTLILSCIDNSECDPCLDNAKLTNNGCDEKRNRTKMSIKMLPVVSPYQKAFIYAMDRDDMATVINKISMSENYLIHPTYDDALVRYQFINKVVDIIKNVVSPVLMIFFMVLIFIQVGIVANNRSHNYGILISKGISWGCIGFGLFLQLLFSLIVSIIISMPLLKLIQFFLDRELLAVVNIQPFSDKIQISDMSIIQVILVDYLFMWTVFFVIIVIICLIIFYLKIVHLGNEPSKLLS